MQPGPSLKVQPCSAMSGSTTDREITFSSFFSLRKMSVLWAQGQASDT